jgi:serpin B
MRSVLNLIVLIVFYGFIGLMAHASPAPPPSLNEFGYRLAAAAARFDGHGAVNRMTSPVAEHLALGMVANGAAGATRERLTKTLGIDGPIKGLSGVHEICQRRLNSVITDDELLPTVRTRNSAWSNTAHASNAFNAEYEAQLRRVYDAEVSALDFSSPMAANAVNAWADHASGSLIPSIISPDALKPLDYLLVNLTYFAGTWEKEFDLIQPERDRWGRTDFKDAAGSVVKVPFISATDDFRHISNESEQIIELPFISPSDASYAFYAVLPNDAAISPSTYNNPTFWSRTLDAMKRVEPKLGEISLPKFAFDYEIELTKESPITAALDLNHLFETSADFTALSARGAHLGLIKEVTRIELDEHGVKAAAAVMAGLVAMGVGPSPEFELNLNRPFAFAIVEKRSGTVLFLGELQDPTGK